MKHGGLLILAVVLVGVGCATHAPKDKAKKGTPPPEPIAKLTQALEQAQEAARQDPNNAELQYKLGNALFDLRRYDEARGAYENAVRLAPNHRSAHSNFALCLKRLGRLPEAIEQYRAALALDANDVTTLNNFIIALEENGDWEGAAKELNRLAELRPDNIQVLTHRANVLFRLKRYSEAATAFEKVLQLDPGRADHYYNLGLCHFCKENWDAALATWLTAVAHDSKNPSANRGLAVVYWKRAEYKRAWEAVARCQALGVPLDPEFIRDLQRDSGQMGP
jgi:tetratricopeptide (TPR) repeat protein